MKAKRAGSGQSGKNSQCLTSASKVQYGKVLELIAGYRSFPPVGPRYWPPPRRRTTVAGGLSAQQATDRSAQPRRAGEAVPLAAAAGPGAPPPGRPAAAPRVAPAPGPC